MIIASIPTMMRRAVTKRLNLSIGFVALGGEWRAWPYPALSRGVIEQTCDKHTLRGHVVRPRARRKKRRAVSRSRSALSRKSMVCPLPSTARYRCRPPRAARSRSVALMHLRASASTPCLTNAQIFLERRASRELGTRSNRHLWTAVQSARGRPGKLMGRPCCSGRGILEGTPRALICTAGIVTLAAVQEASQPATAVSTLCRLGRGKERCRKFWEQSRLRLRSA
jgi:hypothetical protein